ncbi:Nn.00g092760.m01.CDS01 [Neocucurbitaria sp. VM-36]
MHTSFLLTAIALLPLTLAAPAPQRGPPFRLPRPIRSRQNATTNTTTPDAPSAPPPTCDLSNVSQPANTLTPPQSDMHLILIALGQGTQNYTCGADLTLPPSAFGAVAQLYNASCALSSSSSSSSTQESPSIGAHFFLDTSTPDFDIVGLGNTRAKKVEEVLSPQGSGNVKWLRLEAQREGSTSAVREIYRLETVGGVAPGSCEGRGVGEVVTVGYEARYWVYA